MAVLRAFAQNLEDVAEQAEQLITISDNDYLDSSTGLWHCGDCGQAKECVIDFFGKKRKVRCACQCVLAKCKADEQANAEYRRLELARENSRMTARLSANRLENFRLNSKNQEAFDHAIAYVNGFNAEEKQGLLIVGTVGAGKTFLASSIGNALMAKGFSVIFTSVVSLINAGLEEKDEWERLIETADLVIFDDIGAERTGEYASEQVYRFVNTRYEACKPAIFTTNLTGREMQSTQNIALKRIYSRIFEMSGKVLKINAQDERERAFKERLSEQAAKLASNQEL